MLIDKYDARSLEKFSYIHSHVHFLKFHSTIGTKIVEQSPSNFITKETLGESHDDEEEEM